MFAVAGPADRRNGVKAGKVLGRKRFSMGTVGTEGSQQGSRGVRLEIEVSLTAFRESIDEKFDAGVLVDRVLEF
jgi:hypothetical protein